MASSGADNADFCGLTILGTGDHDSVSFGLALCWAELLFTNAVKMVASNVILFIILNIKQDMNLSVSKLNYFCLMGIIKQKVSLKGVRFFSYHGFYPEEQILGTEFILDIDTELVVYGSGGDDISNTVNYERLLQIASEEMKIPRKLIETVAHSILERIRHEFLAVQEIRISISKMHPIMSAEIENSGIELLFSR